MPPLSPGVLWFLNGGRKSKSKRYIKEVNSYMRATVDKLQDNGVASLKWCHLAEL